MTNFKELAKIFEERIEGVDFYETRAVLQVKALLERCLENETKQLLFLISEPGAGKSIFLDRLDEHIPNEVIKFNTPFFEPSDFIKTLIQKADTPIENFSLEEMIVQAVDIYKRKDIVIAIDEAQLLSKDMIELIRILADSKAFWFLLAMHKHESKKILNEPQFSSRPHRVFELGSLEFEEMRGYIDRELLKAAKLGHQGLIDKRVAKYIYKLSRGNFRDTKKILNRTFLLLDFAIAEGKKYKKPNKCLVTMAAIDGGLIEI